jgi:hypothetical protein
MGRAEEDLADRLLRAWSSATATTWTAGTPARGQCSVTAIAVQRMLGGEILKTETAGGAHFYNRIDGVRHDFTAAQFGEAIEYQDLPSDAAEALRDTSDAQLASLMAALGERS